MATLTDQHNHPVDDVASHNEHRASMQQEYERLRVLMDVIPSMFYVFDWDGRVNIANAAAAEFCGLTLESIKGKYLHDILPVPAEAEQALGEMRQIMEKGAPKSLPYAPLTDGKGRKRLLEFSDVPFIDPITGRRCLIGIGTDVTDRVRLEEQRREQQRVERDLEIARGIQRGLLPTESPVIKGFELAGWSEAADHTGGDYYDWLPLADGRIVISIADATGHGIGPALVTSACRAYARATIREDADLGRLMQRMNQLLHEDLPVDHFVTFAAGVIDPKSHCVELLSAGHGPVFFYRAAEQVTASTTSDGPPLAVLPELTLDPARRYQFERGDMLVLVSDGFYECMNEKGEQFGLTRLCESLNAAANRSAQEVINHLLNRINQFVGESLFNDDMTAIVLRRSK